MEKGEVNPCERRGGNSNDTYCHMLVVSFIALTSSSSLIPLLLNCKNLLYSHTMVITNACVGDSDLQNKKVPLILELLIPL